MVKSSKGVVKFELEIWGESDGQEGIITATCDGDYSGWETEAMVQVNVRYKKPAPAKSKRMTFSPAELRSDLDPPQSASYSREMKKVFIYTKFPTVAAFVGTCDSPLWLPESEELESQAIRKIEIVTKNSKLLIFGFIWFPSRYSKTTSDPSSDFPPVRSVLILNSHLLLSAEILCVKLFKVKGLHY